MMPTPLVAEIHPIQHAVLLPVLAPEWCLNGKPILLLLPLRPQARRGLLQTNTRAPTLAGRVRVVEFPRQG